jgi:hypothetical protein
MSFTLTDPLFRRLYERIAEDIDNRVNALSKGAAFIIGSHGNVDAMATALKYQHYTAYIEAMQQVIQTIIELDHDRYSTRNKNTGDDD